MNSPPTARATELFLLLFFFDVVENEVARDSDEAYRVGLSQIKLDTLEWLNKLQQVGKYAFSKLGQDNSGVTLRRAEFELWEVRLPAQKEEFIEMAGRSVADQIYGALESGAIRLHKADFIPNQVARKLIEDGWGARNTKAEIKLMTSVVDDSLEFHVELQRRRIQITNIEETKLTEVRLAMAPQEKIGTELSRLFQLDPEKALEWIQGSRRRNIEHGLDAEDRARLLARAPSGVRAQLVRRWGKNPAPKTPQKQ